MCGLTKSTEETTGNISSPEATTISKRANERQIDRVQRKANTGNVNHHKGEQLIVVAVKNKRLITKWRHLPRGLHCGWKLKLSSI